MLWREKKTLIKKIKEGRKKKTRYRKKFKKKDEYSNKKDPQIQKRCTEKKRLKKEDNIFFLSN